jgi:hypothetical protein
MDAAFPFGVFTLLPGRAQRKLSPGRRASSTRYADFLMATSIKLDGVQRLLATGAQLVETLPEQNYREGHIPGAVSLPLKQLTAERAAELDRGRPVIVYCWDSL